MIKLRGAFTAMITPMKGDGSVDYEGFRKHIKNQLEGGINGLVPLCTTSETPTLDEDEEEKMIEIIMNEVRSWEKVQSKLDEETVNLAKKADEFCQKKIEKAVAEKTAELEDLANKYCEQRCAKITEKAQKKLDAQQKKLEEAAQLYILERFEEMYKEKLGEDLDNLEESLLTNLDRWLEYTLTEKIDPKLIQKAAVNETYEPIINAIKNAFENQYVALLPLVLQRSVKQLQRPLNLENL